MLERQLEEMLSGPAEPGRWVVIDQVALGPTLVPEVLSVRALHRFAVRARWRGQ